MCISQVGEYTYKCCCGCPLICGVIIIFVLNCFDLASSISIDDWWGTAIYGILTACFIMSFIKRHEIKFR